MVRQIAELAMRIMAAYSAGADIDDDSLITANDVAAMEAAGM